MTTDDAEASGGEATKKQETQKSTKRGDQLLKDYYRGPLILGSRKSIRRLTEIQWRC